MGSARTGILLAAVVSALAPGLAGAAEQVLTGNVSYRERVALLPGATVEVRLLDVSRADAPSETIAATVISPEGQVPVPYVLTYDDAVIKPGHSYALRARIERNGRLLFTNTVRHPVLTGGAESTDIMVEKVAANMPEGPEGRWLAEDILGGGVIDNVETVLEIGADGSVTGSGGCNRITGQAKVMGDAITFGPIAATRRACVPAVGDQEQKFFEALGQARRWQADDRRGKLTLLDKDGAAVMVLARHG